MKFLCVPCDQPMRMKTLAPPDRGSLSVVYACEACGYEMAMLTNPHETQLVTSLGVKIGPAPAAAERGGSGAAAQGAEGASGQGCPFSAMIPGLAGEGLAADGAASAPGAAAGGSSPLPWSARATERLAAIPEFVRPMAKSGIERFARDRGYLQIDERVLDEARDFFGM